MRFKFIKAATALLPLAAYAALPTQASAQAGIFEVVHPEVKKGEVELEFLNGFGLNNVEVGDERSVHEFAIGYGFTDYWKFTAAFELANPRGGSAEVEGFELESLFILPFFGGGEHGHSKKEESKHEDDDDHAEFTLGLFTALEIPREGGISDGALEFGPVFETQIGKLNWVGNFLIEVPFEEGDPGIAYASQIVYPVTESIGFGVENFGEFEGAFGNAGEQEHYAGPALYFEAELPNGHVIEPRVAALFGLNDNSSDAILSFNLEYKFGV